MAVYFLRRFKFRLTSFNFLVYFIRYLVRVEEYTVKQIEIPRLMQVLNYPATEDGANYYLPHEGGA